MQNSARALLLLSWLLLPGCFLSRSRSNPPIAPSAVDQIVPGTSTADDVTGWLGAPTEIVQLGRRSAWKYEHTVEKQSAAFLVLLGLRGVDTQADRVWLFFDEHGTVLHVGKTFQAEQAEYDVPIF